MPELPEVETIVSDLRKKVLRRTFIDIWTDWPKTIKRPQTFKQFRKEIIGKKILNVGRRGKNILFHLSQGKILLIHQKLTGHLLFGKWHYEKGKWHSLIPGPILEDPMNRFLHLVFSLDNDMQLALSDLRKFAKVELWDKSELENSKDFKTLGPEPLDNNFTFEKFKNTLLKKKKGKIKQVLMDQKVIAGIGNIYSDETLWLAKVNPFEDIQNLKKEELKLIYDSIRKVLKKGIELGGESISDFRKLDGSRGNFDAWRKVYRREGKKCPRCGTTIQSKKIGGRTAHFCPKCQTM